MLENRNTKCAPFILFKHLKSPLLGISSDIRPSPGTVMRANIKSIASHRVSARSHSITSTLLFPFIVFASSQTSLAIRFAIATLQFLGSSLHSHSTPHIVVSRARKPHSTVSLLQIFMLRKFSSFFTYFCTPCNNSWSSFRPVTAYYPNLATLTTDPFNQVLPRFDSAPILIANIPILAHAGRLKSERTMSVVTVYSLHSARQPWWNRFSLCFKPCQASFTK